jgi:hypothetical protein
MIPKEHEQINGILAELFYLASPNHDAMTAADEIHAGPLVSPCALDDLVYFARFDRCRKASIVSQGSVAADRSSKRDAHPNATHYRMITRDARRGSRDGVARRRA